MKKSLVALLLVMVSLTLVGCGKQETSYCDQYVEMMQTMSAKNPIMTPEHIKQSVNTVKEQMEKQGSSKEQVEMRCKSIVDNKDMMMQQMKQQEAMMDQHKATIDSTTMPSVDTATVSGATTTTETIPVADPTTFPSCEKNIKLMECRFAKQGVSPEMTKQTIDQMKAAREVRPANTRDAYCQQTIDGMKDTYAQLGCTVE